MSTLTKLAVVAMVSMSVARADIIHETSEASVDLWAPSLSDSQWLGMAFSLSQSYMVTAVAAQGMGNGSDTQANSLHAVIYSYNGSFPLQSSIDPYVGAELFSTQFTTPFCCEAFSAGPSDLNWKLGAGNYILVFEVRADDDFQGFIYSDRVEGSTMLVNNGGTWRALNESIGVRIEGIVQVPEPNTLALLLTGLISIAFARKRNAMQVRSSPRLGA